MIASKNSGAKAEGLIERWKAMAIEIGIAIETETAQEIAKETGT